MSGRQISVHRIKRLAGIRECKGPLPISHFAGALKVSRATVRRYLGHIKKSGYSCAELATLRPKEIHAVLKQKTTQQNFLKPNMALMGVFERTLEGLFEGSANLKKSWTEYRKLNPGGYMYSQFVAKFRAWQRTQGVEVARCTPWHIHIREEDVFELEKWRQNGTELLKFFTNLLAFTGQIGLRGV